MINCVRYHITYKTKYTRYILKFFKQHIFGIFQISNERLYKETQKIKVKTTDKMTKLDEEDKFRKRI